MPQYVTYCKNGDCDTIFRIRKKEATNRREREDRYSVKPPDDYKRLQEGPYFYRRFTIFKDFALRCLSCTLQETL